MTMKKKIIPVSFIILFSIILWGSVSLSGEYITTIMAPIKLVELPRNYTTGYISEKTVYLRVKAKGWELSKILLSGDYDFNISALRKIGKRKIDLRKEVQNNPWLASTVQVLEIVPSQVECDIDKIVSKEVNVSGNLNIQYKEGFGAASGISINPTQIKIFGPNSILQNIDTIKTDYKEFLDVSEAINEELKFVEIEGIEYSSKVCTINVDIQKIVDRSFDNIEVEILNVPPSKELILYPSQINVVLNGGINTLGRLTNDSIKAYIDFWDVMRNDGEPIAPNVEFPAFLKLIDILPNKLEYIIKQY